MMTRFSAGIPAPASSIEINWWLAKKRNESNFLSNSCTRFAACHAERLHDRTAAAGARACCAAKTVIACHDLAIFERVGVNVPQKHRMPIVPLHPELLI